MASFQIRDSLTGVEESFINSLSIHTTTTLVQANLLFQPDSFPRLHQIPLLSSPRDTSGSLVSQSRPWCPCFTFFSDYTVSYGKYKIFTFTYKAHIISLLADSHPLPRCPSLSSSWPSSSFPNVLPSSLTQGIWTHHSLSLTHSSNSSKQANKHNERTLSPGYVYMSLPSDVGWLPCSWAPALSLL